MHLTLDIKHLLRRRRPLGLKETLPRLGHDPSKAKGTGESAGALTRFQLGLVLFKQQQRLVLWRRRARLTLRRRRRDRRRSQRRSTLSLDMSPQLIALPWAHCLAFPLQGFRFMLVRVHAALAGLLVLLEQQQRLVLWRRHFPGGIWHNTLGPDELGAAHSGLSLGHAVAGCVTRADGTRQLLEEGLVLRQPGLRLRPPIFLGQQLRLRLRLRRQQVRRQVPTLHILACAPPARSCRQENRETLVLDWLFYTCPLTASSDMK